jgi:hypothetical protein
MDMPASLPRPPIQTRGVAATLGGAIVLIALLCLVTWKSRYDRPAAFSVGGPTSNAPYVGPRLCGECHASEAARHRLSGHARTFDTAAGSPLARRIDGRVVADPERPGVSWKYGLQDGELRASRVDGGRGGVEKYVLDYVLGSGDHAATFVTITDPEKPTAREHRLTYFTESDSLGITPGQRSENPNPGTTDRGRELSSDETLKCLGCHTTPGSLAPPTAPGRAPIAEPGRISPGVLCESCHGPGRAHVTAARNGQAGLSMPFGGGRWTAESQLGLCGQCHRHPSRFAVDRIRPDDPQLARFQPIGLMQSKCYIDSKGELSCVTCHDPHERASKDVVAYETICLSCHGAPSPSPANRACPVSASQGCLGCHMPKVDSSQRVLFTDHWIRIRAAGEPPRP